MPKKFLFAFLFVILPLLVFISWLIPAADLDTLVFFRAIEDKTLYRNNPANYDHNVFKGPLGEKDYYIEQKPTYVIPRDAIQSIVVRQTKRYGSSYEESLKALQETKQPNTEEAFRGPEDYQKGNPFNIMFKVAAPEGQQFSIFTRNNKGGFFQTRIGNKSVALVQFLFPFEPDELGVVEFTFYLREDDPNKISEMLEAFKGKVVWN